MEAAVFTDKRVKELLSRYIIIRLYVDDRTSLNKPQQVKQPDGTMRTLRTVGDRWSYLEQQRFGQLTQPLYVLLRPDGSLLSPTVRSYDEDTEAFLQWLAVK
jgi:thiol:disulfide interchange protein DsbD